jgi:hypothetical protein
MDSKYLIQNTPRVINHEEEDVFSIGNEDDNVNMNCINKLVHLEQENSLSVSSDINDVSEIKFNKKGDFLNKIITPSNNNNYANIFSDKNNNLRKSEEIIKYISDTSGKYFTHIEISIKNYFHFNSKNRHPEMNAENEYNNISLLKINSFSFNFQGDNTKNEENFLLLKKYKQSTEYFENKYKDMLMNYSNLNSKYSNLEDFFIQMTKILKNL